MAYNRYLVPYYNFFGGNQDITISAIDISGGIILTRTTGKTPCFIMASASGITGDGTDTPYEDFFYHWNWGNPASTETFTNPGVGGGTKNSNIDQYGPEAAHCYREPGTYTLTLDIFGYNASGLIHRTLTQEIVVTAFVADEEYWASTSAAALAGTNAGTLANPFFTVAAINTGIGAGDNIWLHCECDSVFDGSLSLKVWGSVVGAVSSTGMRIDTYGTGANPKFNISSGTAVVIEIRNGSGGTEQPKRDIVLTNIDASTSGTAASSVFVINGVNATAIMRDVFLDRCKFHVGDNLVGSSVSGGAFELEGFGLWKCELTCEQVKTTASFGMFMKLSQFMFMMGGLIRGGTDISGISAVHHIYPSIKYHTYYRWIDFQQGTNRNYCINMNYDNEGEALPVRAEFHFIADCGVTGTERFLDAGEDASDPSQTLFRNVVCQGNRIHGLNADGTITPPCMETLTLRDNEAWDLIGGRFLAPDPALGTYKGKHYRNKIHRANSGAGDIFEFSNAEFVLLQQFTRNIIVDLRSTSRMFSLPWTQQTGALVDLNQYYAPNDAGNNGWRDGATEKTFAQWQTAGFDPNGSVADPGWTDGANGDFS